MIKVFAWIGFICGAFICATNFYATFLKALFHRLRKLPNESYKWDSPIPLLGTLFIALSLLCLYSASWILYLGIILMIFDTGGLLYLAFFVIAMSSQAIQDKRK